MMQWVGGILMFLAVVIAVAVAVGGHVRSHWIDIPAVPAGSERKLWRIAGASFGVGLCLVLLPVFVASREISGRRKRVGESTGPIIDADAPNVVWAIDFQHDSLHDGRKFKIASMVDEHTRESLLDITAWSITGGDVVEALKDVIAVRGVPVAIRCDNGPELVSEALQTFCEDHINVRYIPPGEPWRNAFIESFNGRVREECLNMNQWLILLHAQVGITDFKTGYNERHRHSSLD